MVEEWRRGGELRDDVAPGEFVVMPDHVHGLIRIREGRSELGHVIGAFKAAVSRRIRRGDTPVAPPVGPMMRIWQRNYYEIIVRSPEAEQSIAQYIRMNPWRCVQDLGGGLRGMGNPALWEAWKIGVLASRETPGGRLPPRREAGDLRVAGGEENKGDLRVAGGEENKGDLRVAGGEENKGDLRVARTYLGGFHSPVEKEILVALLERKCPVIWCPAWGLDKTVIPPAVMTALEENRMLILEMRNRDGDLAAAEQRNRFVLENADQLWLPHVAPGGMLAQMVKEMRLKGKILA
jgi:hypothetical protein